VTERDLQSWFLRELRALGGWWIPTTGSVHMPRGTPDIVGLFTGSMYALELKTEDGRVRPLQEWTLAEIEKHGGSSHLLRGRREARAFLDALRGKEMCDGKEGEEVEGR